jgi:uncharacterized membrane protein
MSKPPAADFRIEEMVGILLRIGVLTAAGIVAVGGIYYLAGHCSDAIHIHTFHGEAASLRTLSGILAGAFHADARAIIQLGLVLLIATPVARVLFSAVAFALERDRLYVGLTLLVLVVLLYGLFAPGFK